MNSNSPEDTGGRKISWRGWLLMTFVLPMLVRKSHHSLASFARRLARDRVAGPALPSAKVRKRYLVNDQSFGGTRTFRLSARSGSVSRHVLYLHGGAFVFDLMPAHWPVLTGLVDRSGANLVVPLYPLAPEHNVEDAIVAVAAVYETLAVEVGAANIVIAGDSAGGGLALALLHRLRDTGRPMPAGLVLFFPWLDATLSDPAQIALEQLDPVLSIAQLREGARMWTGDLSLADPRASPLFGDHRDMPPTLILVGTNDVLVSDARRFAERCPNALVHEFPGMFHGWIGAPIPEADRALDEAARFILQSARQL